MSGYLDILDRRLNLDLFAEVERIAQLREQKMLVAAEGQEAVMPGPEFEYQAFAHMRPPRPNWFEIGKVFLLLDDQN